MENNQEFIHYTCDYALTRLGFKGKSEAAKAKTKPTKEEGKIPIQNPFAAILSCADARVVPEDIFNVKPNELFVSRVAGNVADPTALGSMEFAVQALHIPVIVVLGHQNCGAVDGALDSICNPGNYQDNLSLLLNYIVPGVVGPIRNGIVDPVQKNALFQAQSLYNRSTVIRDAVAKKRLVICTAYYALDGSTKGKAVPIGPCACHSKA